MSGYVGGRAKKRKRNSILLIFFIVFSILAFYFFPSMQTIESIPSNSLIPSEEEINSPVTTLNIEELELKIFDREQKIIFRNNKIEKLEIELAKSFALNEKLNKIVFDLNEKIDANLDNSDQRDFNLEINNIKNNSKKELKKYLNEIEQNTIQKNKLIKSLDDANSKIKNLKQKYKENVSKNAKLNSQKNDLETEIKELKLLIEEQNLFIKVLKDTTHHG